MPTKLFFLQLSFLQGRELKNCKDFLLGLPNRRRTLKAQRERRQCQEVSPNAYLFFFFSTTVTCRKSPHSTHTKVPITVPRIFCDASSLRGGREGETPKSKCTTLEEKIFGLLVKKVPWFFTRVVCFSFFFSPKLKLRQKTTVFFSLPENMAFSKNRREISDSCLFNALFRINTFLLSFLTGFVHICKYWQRSFSSDKRSHIQA